MTFVKGDRALSIHPRVWLGGGVKKNTCKPRSVARLKRALAGITRHLDSHPGDAAARQRQANLVLRIGGH